MNYKNDWENKKYLAPKPVLITVVMIIFISIVIIAYKLITGTAVPAFSGFIGL